MSKPAISFLALFIISYSLLGQYQFKDVKRLDCTGVKSQDRTGTCWSFATSSFLESEALRMGHEAVNLSEMFAVRNIYRDKAYNYVYRQGKANFSQGSLSHDVLRSLAMYGAVPESVFSGLENAEDKHNHGEMERALKGMLDGVIQSKNLSSKWDEAIDAVLDVYLGKVPDQFEVNGQTYTPESYAQSLGIDPDQYVGLTSFTHHPYYRPFILEIADNYSNGAYYNLPLDEMMEVIDHAILKGYTIAWDGDVSEKGFDARQGLAILPEDESRDDLFDIPGKEMRVDADRRQQGFESYNTTDDHLMHLVGAAKDQNGSPYYIIKNSWGEISDYKGFLYMSRPYVQMKTMAIYLHKDAIPEKIRKNLNI